MRLIVGLFVTVLCLTAGWAQAPKDGKKDEKPKDEQLNKRYGLEADLVYYPQDTPKNALESVLKAIGRKRINYLLAHLADPRFVDDRVKNYGGNFDELVRETTRKLIDEPATAKELERFFKDGEWEDGDTMATAKIKEVKDRRVFFHKIGTRWFLENRVKPDVAAK
jgi:hypothetical protein